MSTLTQRKSRHKKLSRLIQQVLEAYNLTHQELAKELNVGGKSIWWWIHKGGPRTDETYKRIYSDLKYFMSKVEQTPAVPKPYPLPKAPEAGVIMPEENTPDPVPDNPVAAPLGAALPLTNPLDVQVGGSHYKDSSIQPVQYIEANKLGFLEGSIVKRVTRHGKPTGKGAEDLQKVIHEAQLLLALRYDQGNKA